MSDAARTLLRDWLRRQLSAAQNDWLDEQLAAIAKAPGDATDETLHIALGMVPRRLGKADLELSEADCAAADTALPGWDPRGWSVTDAARILLLRSLPRGGKPFADRFRALCQTDFDAKDLGLSIKETESGLEKAVERGSILRSQHKADVFYFLNSPRGRAAAEAFAKGQWRESARILSAPPVERPNVFKLYEENIGALTPLIADALKDAEELYDPAWIADAIEVAVKNNKRNWKYCEAILKRWKEEGRAEKQDRRNAEKDRRKYVEGEYSDFIEH